MKDIKSVLENRKSNRDFAGQVNLDIVRETVKLAQRTACSMNAQQISVVMITEQDKLEQISQINWGQEHIKSCSAFLLFVLDNNRQDAVIAMENGGKVGIQDDIESIVVGSVDAGLIAQSVELLLQAQGIGTCFIGGVRNNIKAVAKLAGITGIATPLLGIAVGNVDTIENDQLDIRPRVNFESFFFEGQYDEAKVRNGAVDYNEQLNKWWELRGEGEHQSYAQSMMQSYTKSYIPHLFSDLQAMGYLGDYQKKDK
ncbi:nitroreductase family protein [Mollicutes bacterium LVI A0039]|nr:nitroreductase family protein [Mollicutes bacterium LVI A0039]